MLTADRSARYTMPPTASFPPYDYDVAVIGAGPAGMTAAIRTRWVKSYKSVPCSTVLIDGAGLGGLAKWRSCMLTGPSFHLPGSEVVGHFRQDIEDLEIPLITSHVVNIDFEGPVKTVYTESGAVVRVLAVIIATGFRTLCNEQDYLQHIAITYMGYEFFAELLCNFFNLEGRHTVVVVGNEFTRNLVDLIESCNNGRHQIIYLLNTNTHNPQLPQATGAVIQGKIMRYEGDRSLEGIRIMTKDAGEQFIPCSKVLLDYNSYELAPLYEFDVSPLKKTVRGFIKVDREMRTNIAGVYAAGDVTGLYATVGRAIGDGIVAGFSAYQDIFKLKFKQQPCLFAYAARDIKITPGFKDLPRLRPHLKPKVIVSSGRAARLAAEYAAKHQLPADTLARLVAACNGVHSIAEQRAVFNLEQSVVNNLIEFLVEKKAVALHR